MMKVTTKQITVYVLQCKKCKKDIAYSFKEIVMDAYCSVTCATGLPLLGGNNEHGFE